MNAFKWVCGTSTRPRRPTATTATEARDFSPQEALPGLPDHVAVTHILRGDIFDDPADLARLRTVSRAMRAAVAETGLRFTKLGEDEAVDLGCLTSLQRRQRGGRLSRQERLCWAAARGGNLEKLKEFRANGCPWGVMTCPYAASGGHLEMPVPQEAVCAKLLQLHEISTPRRCVTKKFLTRQAASPLQALQRA
jgi:hypothetical protein